MRIVFAGGMSISAAVLEMLCEAGERPVLAFGYPPSLAHRSNYVSLAPLAERYGFPLVETDDIKSAEFERRVREADPDWLMVFGWSQLVPDAALRVPRRGSLGLHMSKLPEGRGRAPVPWTLIRGLREGAVSVFWMKPAADVGEIAVQRTFPVSPFDDAATLVEMVTRISCEIVRDALPQLRAGTLPCVPQDESRATHWPKRTPKDGIIDWSAPVERTYDLVRGVTRPFPGAFTYLDGEKVYVWRAGRLEVPVRAAPGSVLGPYVAHGTPELAGLAVAAPDGVLVCHAIQPTGGTTLEGRALFEIARRWTGRRFDAPRHRGARPASHRVAPSPA